VDVSTLLYVCLALSEVVYGGGGGALHHEAKSICPAKEFIFLTYALGKSPKTRTSSMDCFDLTIFIG